MVIKNDGWPESFGFKIAGDAPVVVVSVLANSVAESAGLHVGDQILEINDKNVQGLSKEQVILVARRSNRVPPSLAVISRIRTFRLQRRRREGYGLALRDSRPVHVEQVLKGSTSYEAGICPGDMIIQVNGQSVKRMNKNEVHKLIERSGNSVKLKLIAGNSAIKRFEDKYMARTSSHHKKAREFFKQMNYYLTGEEHKKTLLIALMKRYAKDRDIERFSRLVSSLLTSEVQRRLLKPIRYFIPNRHKPYFDAIVSQNYASNPLLQSATLRVGDRQSSPRENQNFDIPTPRSMTWSRTTSTPFPGKEKRTSSFSRIIDKSRQREHPFRLINLERDSGQGPFGFTITGYNPVFLRSVDEGGLAEAAGLKCGDCILEINGIDVSQTTHDTVIELLKNSGKSPTLLVQWHPVPDGLKNGISPIRPEGNLSRQGSGRQQQNGDNSGSDSALESDISPRNETGNEGTAVNPEPDQNDLLRHLKEQMKKLLTRGEQLVVRQSLSYYHKDRNVKRLIEALEPVLDDPLKLQMLHCISRLLPPNAQLEFEQLAVEMVARHMDSGIIISASTTPHEMFDILFRVQGSQLADTDRPRNLIGGLVDVKTDSSPSSKQISTSNSTGSLGSDVDRTARKQNSSYEDIAPVGDSTVEALMAIDDGQLMSSPNDSGSSLVLATAIVHAQPEGKQGRSASKSKKVSDTNNNEEQEERQGGRERVESTNIDDVFGEEAGDDRTKLTQKDIDDLKAELRKAQEEAKKVRIEAEEGRDTLGPINETGLGSSTQGKGGPPKSLSDEIKNKSFEMEPERLRSVSTDDHVILPGQFLPPPPPPPPMAPPAPPPPPPPGNANAMKLKRINWEKLSGVAIENTVWGKIGNEDELDEMIDFKELEALFSTKNVPKKEKKTEKKQTSMLDSKKTYNLSILLGHLKMPIDEIYKAVLAVDESKLSEPHIKTLQMCAPERLEVEQFKGFTGDTKAMSSSDAFTAKMLTMPNYNERLHAMLFKARFYDRLDEILPDIESVSLASEEVMSSKKLMKILEIVLATGNYMNQGSSRMSGASGFKISFLTKLISTKTSDNKSTLLHVIVNTIKNNKSELLDVKDELSNVPQAAKVSSQMLSLEIAELRTGMKEIQDELRNYQSSGSDDKYEEVIGQFVKNAERQFKDVLDAYEKMTTEFKKAAEFYSEIQITTEDFFGAFAVFLQNFESVKKDVMSEEEKREYYARKEKELEEMRKRRGSSVSRSRTQSVDTHTSMQPVPENEVVKGFEAILKKRFENDDEIDGKEEKSAPNGLKDSPTDATNAATKLSIRRVSENLSASPEDANRMERALIGSSPRKGSSSSEDAAKPSSPLRSFSLSKPAEKDGDAFAALLKRRQMIEDTESEMERTESSASELSAFSTLPRAKTKPPHPMPKKKKVPPPPPLKPKPKPVGADLRAATLPRSMPKASKELDISAKKPVTKMKSDSSANQSQKSMQNSLSLDDLGNAPHKTNFEKIRSTLDQKSKDEVEKRNGKKDFSKNQLVKSKYVSSSFDDVGKLPHNTQIEQVKSNFDRKPKNEIEKQSDKRDLSSKGETAAKLNSLENGEEKKISVVSVEVGRRMEQPKFVSEDANSNSNSKKSSEVLVNMRLPTYKVEVSYTDRDATHDDTNQLGRLRSASIDAPKKPTRVINDRVTIKPFEPPPDYDHDDDDYDNLPSDKLIEDDNSKALSQTKIDLTVKPKSYDHDDDDYDNLPSDNITVVDVSREEPIIEPVCDEPDYAIPDFAIDHRNLNKNATEPQVVDEELVDIHKYHSLNRDPGNGTDMKKSTGLGKSNRKLARSLSLSSSQSSDGDSPKSYRKFKQNRSASSKTRSSPFQKIKGVIDGMRSRSSSDASTTSYDPKPDNKALNDFSNWSPKPILKSVEHGGFLNRSDSPRTVTFKALTVKDALKSDVVKLSSDSDDVAEDSIKIPAVSKEQLPPAPLEPVAPPIPPLHRLKEPLKDSNVKPPPIPTPYHVQKRSSIKSASNTSTQSYLPSYVPPPPSTQPPPPPPSSKPKPPSYPPPPLSDDKEKPPPMPMPYHVQKRLSLNSKSPPRSGSLPSPPSDPPPTEPPPPPPPSQPLPTSRLPPSLDSLKLTPSESSTTSSSCDLSVPGVSAPVGEYPLSPSIPNFKPPPPPIPKDKKPKAGPEDTKSSQSHPVATAGPPPPPFKPKNILTDKKVPPPPPKRIESIQSSASYVKEAIDRTTNGAGRISTGKTDEGIDLDAEFGRNAKQANGLVDGTSLKDQINGFGTHRKDASKPILTPPPDDITEPLGDIEIVPPPPSPSPPKGSFLEKFKNEMSNGINTENTKPSVPEKPKIAEPMSMYMVKVLPTSPPLILRDDEIGEINTEETNNQRNIDDNLANTDVDSNELEIRSKRTDSVSSVSSVSFPPLPPESLLARVEENSDDGHFDESQVIFHF